MGFFESVVLVNLITISIMLVIISRNVNLSKRDKSTLVIIYLILGVTSAIEGIVNYFEETNLSQVVKFIELTTAIIILFAYINMFKKYFKNENIFILIGITILAIIGIVTQLVNPELKICLLCIVSASNLAYSYYVEIFMNVDCLTELLNQNSYKNNLEEIKKSVTILLFDVDAFKEINDNYGHNFGDYVLAIIGKTIKKVYSKHGHCYRIVGDEFCVILPRSKKYSKLNSDFIQELEKARETEPRIPYISIGCAKFNPKKEKAFEAIERADKDLYFWKEKLKKKRSNESKCEW